MLSYLDGQTGAMLAAALAGGVGGVAVLLKMYWYRLTGVFSKKARQRATDTQLELLADRNPELVDAAATQSGGDSTADS